LISRTQYVVEDNQRVAGQERKLRSDGRT
jgi:hypothetical protein